jgi:hypothetical protein
MEYVPLENGGGSGSLGAHWEKFVMGNEMMVSDDVFNTILSELTLRLFEDSGWYEVNYDMAETTTWGKGAGCGILKGECSLFGEKCSNVDTSDTSEGWSVKGIRVNAGCYHDYTGQVLCQSGNSKFLDNCEFLMNAKRNADCRRPENFQHNNGAEELGEFYGLGSRCFEGDIQLVVGGYYVNNRAFCLDSRCENGNLIVKINKKEVTCRTTGEKITNPAGLEGSLICPDIEKFCSFKKASCEKDCHFNGRCVANNKCWCYPGYFGDSCQLKGQKPKNKGDVVVKEAEDDDDDGYDKTAKGEPKANGGSQKGNPGVKEDPKPETPKPKNSSQSENNQDVNKPEEGKKSKKSQTSCENSVACWDISLHSSCVDGKCQCDDGYEGDNCENFAAGIKGTQCWADFDCGAGLTCKANVCA